MADLLTDLRAKADELQKVGEVAKALELAESSLPDVAIEFGEKSLEYAAALNDVGTLYRFRGDYVSAARFFRIAAEVLEDAVGADDPEYATAIMNLAGVQRLNGELEESIQLFERAKGVYRDTLGADSVSYLTAVNNVALCWQDIKDYERALSAHIEVCMALEALCEGSSEYLVEYATSLFNTGLCFRQFGEIDMGDEMIARSAAVYQQVLPEGHPLLERAKAAEKA